MCMSLSHDSVYHTQSHEVSMCTSTCSIRGTFVTTLTRAGRFVKISHGFQTVKRIRDIKQVTLVSLTPRESTIAHSMCLSNLIV
jgi:hypothetical protein